MENKDLTGVYDLHGNTFEVNGDMWEIKNKYDSKNSLFLINKTKDKYISGLFKIKKHIGILNFDYQGVMYLFCVDKDAVFIQYIEEKRKKYGE